MLGLFLCFKIVEICFFGLFELLVYLVIWINILWLFIVFKFCFLGMKIFCIICLLFGMIKLKCLVWLYVLIIWVIECFLIDLIFFLILFLCLFFDWWIFIIIVFLFKVWLIFVGGINIFFIFLFLGFRKVKFFLFWFNVFLINFDWFLELCFFWYLFVFECLINFDCFNFISILIKFLNELVLFKFNVFWKFEIDIGLYLGWLIIFFIDCFKFIMFFFFNVKIFFYFD